MQGWFYWSLPFLVFFFIKFSESPSIALWLLNGLYIVYFIFSKDSDLFESLQPIAAQLSMHINPYLMLAAAGRDPVMSQNIIFTVLETMTIASAVWAYSVGMNTIQLFQKKKQRFILGIAGDSGVGKSTLASVLEKVIGSHNATVLNGDDLHKWERTDSRWQEVTHLNPKGNRIHTDLDHAVAFLKGQSVQRLAYDHATGTFVGPMELKPNKFILFQGLMPFILDRMRELQDLKIYVEADENLRQRWKMKRDQSERGQEAAAVQKQIDERKPDAEKFILPQKSFADWTIRYAERAEGDFYAEYIFKNSVFVETLIEELSKISSLSIEHAYDGLVFQKITVGGTIAADRVKEIAYRLYPNMFDLVENQPVFEADLKGVHQLFFINYLNHFYRLKLRYEELS